jgi:hypothetical protein
VEDDGNSSEMARLRALGAWMRDVGACELSVEGVHIRLGPAPPPPIIGTTESRDEDDESAGVSAAERAHYNYFRRLTRSSGAPIPPYRERKGTSQ